MSSHLADQVTGLAVVLILFTWAAVFILVLMWVAWHRDELAPSKLFKKRRHTGAQGQGGGNRLAIASLIVAVLSLLSATLLGIAQLLRHWWANYECLSAPSLPVPPSARPALPAYG